MIYADAGIIIRLIEGDVRIRAPISARLEAVRVERPFILTSCLSRLECRCKPMRRNQEGLLKLYDAFFASPEVVVGEIGADVVEKATELRASVGFKTPDAIHAATAILKGDFRILDSRPWLHQVRRAES